MAQEDREKPAPPGPAAEITLLDAIEQVLHTRDLLNEMTGRVGSIERQRSRTRQRVVLDELDEEERRTRHAIRTTANEIEKMAQFFAETKFFINDREILAEDAVRRLVDMGRDVKGFVHLMKDVSIDTFGNQRLSSALAQFRASVQECYDVWQEEILAYALLLRGVKIPDSAMDLFQSVWTDRNTIVRIYVKWDAAKSKWTEVNGEVEDPRLRQYIEDVSILSRNEGIPDGFEAVIEAMTDLYGKTTFRVKVTRPHGNTSATDTASRSGRRNSAGFGADPYFYPGTSNSA